jgi:ABC-type Mn2+/Zn2+ transport system permease subunit
VAINLVRQRSAVRGDTATGVFFSVSFALAVVLISLRPASAPPVNLETLLFGSILAVTPAMVTALAVVAALVMVSVTLLWSRLAYATFDPELAALSGVPVQRLEHILLALTAVVVVVGVRTVGVVLVSACIVVPAATARVVGGSLARMAVLAVGVGVFGTFVGLLGSYHLNVPSGAAIVLVLGALFFAALALGPQARR